MAPVVLLGPQGTQPTAGGVLAELGVRGKVALVRAGYQERESEDADMVASLGVPAVNLKLHARSIEVFREDTELTTAYSARQQRLRHIQAFYRVRLDKIEDAAKNISVRYVEGELLEMEEKVTVDQFRHIDADHIERCNAVRYEFDKNWRFVDRPVIARHREELRKELATCDALVIAGGHVASLLNRLAMFGVLELAAGKPIVAWSAGAMVLTERIVLFHDYPPYGSDIAQVLDAGFAIAPGLVVLPDPHRRVNFDAKAGIQRFARRMAPATCVAMDHGSRVVFEGDKIVRANGVRLTTTGAVDLDWNGSPTRFSNPFLRGVPL
ncbi:MAG TPA: Type 1 glutamine amidotransferase-like domain-containing protein [Kofleriaceae bacterium]|nr:Type 1 glutamine amidotransferase-like domain-containing protein [Kofleriaceae bacterium]